MKSLIVFLVCNDFTCVIKNNRPIAFELTTV